MIYTSFLPKELQATVLARHGQQQLELTPDGTYYITDKIGGTDVTFLPDGMWTVSTHHRSPNSRMVKELTKIAAIKSATTEEQYNGY